jgi:LysR family transcriptional regulator of gallate degradation
MFMEARALPALMHIRAFVRVAEQGSISRACEVLLRAQSVITRSLHELEDRLGAPLFERRPSGMLMTPHGKAILPRAQRILAELDSIPALLGRTGHEPVYLLQSKRLEIFVKLCETHHMQTVAKAFGLTQPAISAALKVLESGVGRALFERSSRGLQPTQASQEILYPIRRALNDLRRLDADVAAITGAVQGSVMVGALPLGRTRILPQAIIKVLARHPGISVATNESPFSMLATELRAGDIDFVFGALRDSDYATDLQSEELVTEEMVVLVRKGHPLMSAFEGMEDFDGANWIFPRADTPARVLLDTHFRAFGFPSPVPVVETGDLAIIRGLLLHSDMLAVVSAHQLEHEIASGELQILPLGLEDTSRPIGLIYRTNSLPSPAAIAVMEAIRSITKKPRERC